MIDDIRLRELIRESEDRSRNYPISHKELSYYRDVGVILNAILVSRKTGNPGDTDQPAST